MSKKKKPEPKEPVVSDDEISNDYENPFHRALQQQVTATILNRTRGLNLPVKKVVDLPEIETPEPEK